MTTVSERLSVHIDDPSLNGKDSFNGQRNGSHPITLAKHPINTFIPPENIPALTRLESRLVAHMPKDGSSIVRWELEQIMAPDIMRSAAENAAVDHLSQKLEPQGFSIQRFNPGRPAPSEWHWELTQPTPVENSSLNQSPILSHDDSRQEAFEQASDYAEEQARGIRRVDPIHHDNSRDEAFAAVAEFDEEQRVARQNQRPPLSPRTQELRARMLAHNPIQPSDGTVIEAQMPLGPLVEESHRALKKISPSPSLQDSIQKFEAFKQEQRRQKVQERWDQRQQRIETRKRIQEWTHEQQAQITTTQIPEVAEEAERRRQAAAATEDDQVLIDFSKRNEDYKKSQALERDLLLLLRANGRNGVHHFHMKKFAQEHGFQSPDDLLRQTFGLKKNGMSIRHTVERGGGRFYLNGDVSSLTQESLEEPQTEKPAHSVQTPAVASAPVVKPKEESPKPPYEMADAPIKRENPQEPQLELSPFERRLGEVKTRLNGPPQMVFDAFLRLQAQHKPTTPEAIAWEAFPSWTPEKAMIRYQKGVDELRVIMNTQGLDITTYFDEAGSTLVNFERTSKKTS